MITNVQSSLELAGRFFSARMFFLNPHNFYTLSLDNFEVPTSQFLCGNPAVRTTESRHDVRPARCRGQLSRVTIFFPACYRGKHICLLSVRPTFRLAFSLGVRPDYDFFEPHSFLCFPLFWGNTFFDRLSTVFVSDTSQWSRACCMLGIFDWWATAWIDCSQAPSYCVNWLFISSTSSTSHRGFPCVLPNIYGSSRRSLGWLRLAAIADIVAYRRMKFMVSTHCSCEFSTPVVCMCT